MKRCSDSLMIFQHVPKKNAEKLTICKVCSDFDRSAGRMIGLLSTFIV